MWLEGIIPEHYTGYTKPRRRESDPQWGGRAGLPSLQALDRAATSADGPAWMKIEQIPQGDAPRASPPSSPRVARSKHPPWNNPCTEKANTKKKQKRRRTWEEGRLLTTHRPLYRNGGKGSSPASPASRTVRSQAATTLSSREPPAKLPGAPTVYL